MTGQMNSSHSSSLLAVLLALVLAVGAAGAVNVSDDAPDEAQAGADVTATFELTDLYSTYEQYTLQGRTELTNVTWTVEMFNAADTKIDAGGTYDGQTFAHPVSIDSNAVRVRVSVTGTVPAVENFTYDPEERFLVTNLMQARQNGTSSGIATVRAHHYTEESQQARQAIDAARAAIDEAGGHEEAERTLESAISAYNNENFQNAVNLAQQAEETASEARASQSRNELILMAIGALLVIGLLVGGFIYWRNSRTTSRL